jgi:hypothetical protein
LLVRPIGFDPPAKIVENILKSNRWCAWTDCSRLRGDVQPAAAPGCRTADHLVRRSVLQATQINEK